MKVFAIVLCLTLAGSALASQFNNKWRNNRDDDSSDSEDSSEDSLSDFYRNFKKNSLGLRDGIDFNRLFCNGCVLAVNGTKYLVEKNHSSLDRLKTELITLIRNGPCPYWKEYLENAVNQFAQTVQDKLIGNTAQQICQQVWRPCQGQGEQVIHSMPALCPTCKAVTTAIKAFIDKGLDSGFTPDDAKKVCALLPFPFRPNCERFVDKYAKQIYDWIKNHQYTPEQVCTFLTFC